MVLDAVESGSEAEVVHHMSEKHLWEPENRDGRLFPAYSYTAYLREVSELAYLRVDLDLGFGVVLKDQSFQLNGVKYTVSRATSPGRRKLAQRIRNALMASDGRLLLLVHRLTVAEHGIYAGYAVDVFYSDTAAPGVGPIYLNALVADGDTTVEE